MENKQRNMKIAFAILAILLVSSTLVACINLGENALVTAAPSTSDLLQYEWPQLAGDDAHTRFSEGPAPDRPDRQTMEIH